MVTIAMDLVFTAVVSLLPPDHGCHRHNYYRIDHYRHRRLYYGRARQLLAGQNCEGAASSQVIKVGELKIIFWPLALEWTTD